MGCTTKEIKLIINYPTNRKITRREQYRWHREYKKTLTRKQKWSKDENRFLFLCFSYHMWGSKIWGGFTDLITGKVEGKKP